jgi:Lon protease-like protein
MSSIPSGEFVVPLFPLPGTVFFPQTRLPLHVFEPRYKQMVENALVADERIGIVLLESGWEADYFGLPRIHSFGTVGVIEDSILLDDGRYNLLLGGEVRFEIVEEIEAAPEVLYRSARVRALPEAKVAPAVSQKALDRLRGLARRYLEYMPGSTEMPDLGVVAFEELTNALVMSLGLETHQKQQLLEVRTLIDRSEQVSEMIETRLEALEFLAPYRLDADPGSN